MGNFSGATPKPHMIFSQDRQLVDSIMTRAGYMSKNMQSSFKKSLVTKYIDKNGVARRTGKRQELKESQPLGYMIWLRVKFLKLLCPSCLGSCC